MFRLTIVLYLFLAFLVPSSYAATEAPEVVATIVVHGFDPEGASSTGTFGNDKTADYIAEIAATAGLPISTLAPFAPNQIAYTTYYGDTYPAYYTAQDIADLQAVTTEFGGGVPRYAMIIAKYAKEVMRRSGAKQVNIIAVSFGGLISRYMIEKDVEGLASSGTIARWISIEGVLAGNYAATYGGIYAEIFFTTYYGGAPVDLNHMKYEWVTANLNNPRDSSSSPYLGSIPVHFWAASDDDFNSKYLTLLSGKANDGVVLVEDAVLRNLEPQSKYLGLPPTESITSTNHESTKDHEGIRAGLMAQLFGRKRVTVTLQDVMVKKEFDGGVRGQGEYVFGLRVFSPLAETSLGITKPIHQYRAEDSFFPYVRLSPQSPQTINQTWFDDMVLPGETQLRIDTNVDEVDGDLIYEIGEATDESYTSLQDTTVMVDILDNGSYVLETDDWRATIRVAITEYPAFGEDPQGPAASENWMLYE